MYIDKLARKVMSYFWMRVFFPSMIKHYHSRYISSNIHSNLHFIYDAF